MCEKLLLFAFFPVFLVIRFCTCFLFFSFFLFLAFIFNVAVFLWFVCSCKCCLFHCAFLVCVRFVFASSLSLSSSRIGIT